MELITPGRSANSILLAHMPTVGSLSAALTNAASQPGSGFGVVVQRHHITAVARRMPWLTAAAKPKLRSLGQYAHRWEARSHPLN